MTAQRERAKAARKDARGRRRPARRATARSSSSSAPPSSSATPTTETEARVLAVLPAARRRRRRLVEIFLDRTPFYAESGGQVGDTGTITHRDRRGRGARHHVRAARTCAATRRASSTARSPPARRRPAAIDVDRRDAIRRNHTGTHLLHYALRHVLGEHVKQAGSLVGPDRLRFDFSPLRRASPTTRSSEIERLANARDARATRRCASFETTKDEAEAMGAIAFFGDKYGDIVRVLEAGPLDRAVRRHARARHRRHRHDQGRQRERRSAPTCAASRRSPGANSVRSAAARRAAARRHRPARRHHRRRSVDGVQRKLDEIKSLQDELKAAARRSWPAGRAAELAAAADRRRGGRSASTASSPSDLRDLAIAVRQQPGVRRVVLDGRDADRWRVARRRGRSPATASRPPT